ncbi:uncharacterized protein LOC116342527 isoform X2 [Contarinia nasturtii]|uniref:uncharacterized protein LOC116342527 isoform X2 n=1 Tax=Contarinia nasturtii TaxID=265458 RepID=UPI0012D444E6|nr:uncharacterized protein LOC116342527 isoform X2 [Contarinia nasturtii]
MSMSNVGYKLNNKTMLCKLILDNRQIFKQFYLHRAYCTRNDAIETVLRSEFCFTRLKASTFLNKNEFLLECQPDEMKKTLKQLKRLKFHINDIGMHPKVLLQTEYELLNNFQRLKEVGFTEVTTYRLAYIKRIMLKSVRFNQCFNFLPKNIDIIKNIFASANVPLVNDIGYADQMSLEAVHRVALRNYMMNQIKYTDAEIDKVWTNWASLKKRSLQSIAQTVELLEKTYQVPMKQLPNHMLLLQPEDIQEMVHTDRLNGYDVKYMMRNVKRCNLEHLKKIQTTCYSYNISDGALKFTPKLFQMNVDVLIERAEQIAKMKRGTEFLEHVGIGRLIVGMGRLQQYAISKDILFENILTDDFIDFFLNGYLMKRNNPAIFYLSDELGKEVDDIQKALRVHPHWNSSTYRTVSANLKYLLCQGFTREDIFNDLPIVLYSLVEIKDVFNRLSDPEEMKKLQIVPDELSKSQILQLCIYFIEQKCNFNYEGMFLNSDATQFQDDESIRFEEIIKATYLQ